jgi:hypothetical protein
MHGGRCWSELLECAARRYARGSEKEFTCSPDHNFRPERGPWRRVLILRLYPTIYDYMYDYCMSMSMWLLINVSDTKRVSNSSLVSFPALEGTWRPMNSTLTAMLSVGNTEHVHPCVTKKTASP